MYSLVDEVYQPDIAAIIQAGRRFSRIQNFRDLCDAYAGVFQQLAKHITPGRITPDLIAPARFRKGFLDRFGIDLEAYSELDVLGREELVVDFIDREDAERNRDL